MATTWWQQLQNRFCIATTWWKELQNRFCVATTRWKELQNRFGNATTWWQEPQNRFGIATTWWQDFTKKSLTAPLVHLQGSRKRTALPVNRYSSAKTLLLQLKQNNFWWPFSSWQTTTILQISITILTEFPNAKITHDNVAHVRRKSWNVRAVRRSFLKQPQNHKQRTEEDRTNYFLSLMRGAAF